MKTAIKTKDLLTIINPINDSIYYKNEQIKIDFNELNKYVLNPTKFNIFIKDKDLLIDFYKNAALYIINNNQPKIFSLDLNKSNPIENGLFEYIKNIYEKQPLSFIELPEDGDNNLLIKSKSLIPLENNTEYQRENLNKATDTSFADLELVFANTEKPKTVEKEKFFWKEDSNDLYANEDFVIEKIKELFNIYKSSKEQEITSHINNLFSKIDKQLLESEIFQINLLSLSIEKLNCSLVLGEYKNFVNIDFSKTCIKDLIVKQIENDNFLLLENMYVGNKSRYTTNETIKNFDFSALINKAETINYLMTKYNYNSHFSDNNFSLKNVYSNLELHFKENKDVVLKFIEQCTDKTMNRDTYISHSNLIKLPLSVYESKELVSQFIQYINFCDLSEFLKKTNQNIQLFSDKEFILEYAGKLQDYKLAGLITRFIPENEITKDFYLKLIEKNPKIYKQFKDNSHPSIFSTLSSDMNIISKAVEHGLELDNIPFLNMKNNLLENSENLEHEKLKLKYLIKNGYINSEGKKFFTKTENITFFNEKYNKPEYVFFETREGWGIDSKKHKLLTKIKNKETVLDLIKTISKLSKELNFKFIANSFYAALNEPLKNNIEIIEKLLPNNLKYQQLNDSMKYNSSLALTFIERDSSVTGQIPPQFFNDINFSLEFVKLMDQGSIQGNHVPPFITKFFENQEVTENYYPYLKTYISFSDLKENIKSKEQQESKNKNAKI